MLEVSTSSASSSSGDEEVMQQPVQASLPKVILYFLGITNCKNLIPNCFVKMHNGSPHTKASKACAQKICQDMVSGEAVYILA